MRRVRGGASEAIRGHQRPSETLSHLQDQSEHRPHFPHLDVPVGVAARSRLGGRRAQRDQLRERRAVAGGVLTRRAERSAEGHLRRQSERQLEAIREAIGGNP